MSLGLHQHLAAGMAALKAGDLPAAIAAFAAAHALAPTDEGVIRSLATLYNQHRRFAESLPVCQQGLRLWPDDPMLTDLYLEALGGEAPSDAAIAAARVWAAGPGAPPRSAFRLGSLLLARHETGEALEHLRRGLQEGRAEHFSTAAEAAFRLGQHDSARQWLAAAVDLEPHNRSLRLARATILLSLGDWAEGLRDYEARLWPGATPEIRRHLPDELPRWTGEAIAGRRLLICAEQGIGDQIRFLTQLPHLLALKVWVIVEASARLVPLLQRAWPDLPIFAADETSLGGRHVFGYDWLQKTSAPDCYIEGGSLALRLFECGIAPDAVERILDLQE